MEYFVKSLNKILPVIIITFLSKLSNGSTCILKMTPKLLQQLN